MPGKPGAMTAGHKEALAAGRANGRIVRLYLEALERNKPKRGRKPSTEALQKQLLSIDEALVDADPLQRLQLIQTRKDLKERLAAAEGHKELPELEAGFIKVAAAYSESKSINYATWREAGVSAAVLKLAGISATS